MPDLIYKLPFFINPMKMNLLNNNNFISYSYQKEITFNNISAQLINKDSDTPTIIVSLLNKNLKKILDNRIYNFERKLLHNNSIKNIAYRCLNKDESINIKDENLKIYSFFKTLTFNKLYIKSNKNKLEFTKNHNNLLLKSTLLSVSLLYNKNQSLKNKV